MTKEIGSSGVSDADFVEAAEWRQSLWVPVLKEALGQSPLHDWKGLRVLEVGFHTGRLAVLLAKLGAHVHGVDKKGKDYAEALEYVRRSGLQERCRLDVGDFLHCEGSTTLS